jgi:thioredoxin 1
MASVPYITDAEFKSAVLDSNVPVLLDFTAAWCGPCKRIAPLLDQVADEKKGQVKVCKMDVDQNMETPNSFGVQSIPTLLLFKDGKLFERHVGALSKPDLDRFVGKALATATRAAVP